MLDGSRINSKLWARPDKCHRDKRQNAICNSRVLIWRGTFLGDSEDELPQAMQKNLDPLSHIKQLRRRYVSHGSIVTPLPRIRRESRPVTSRALYCDACRATRGKSTAPCTMAVTMCRRSPSRAFFYASPWHFGRVQKGARSPTRKCSGIRQSPQHRQHLGRLPGLFLSTARQTRNPSS